MTQTDFDLNDYLAEKRRLIDAELERILQLPQVPARLADAMRYSVTAGGKRLRPILCMAAADAIGEPVADLLPIACAVELIHTYSLIHDDLPAMDNDALRRGKPTCHVAFDEATAILAGDALLTLAFGILSEIGNSDPQKAAACLQVIEIIADAAGGSGMVGGQMLDMSAEGRPVSLTDLQTLQQMKTGALIRASVCAGSIAAGASAAQIESLDMYAVNIGLAFQIADDVLNVEGDPHRLGKAVGSDAARDKSTYPSLLGIAESKALAGEKIDKALQALSIFDDRADPLRAIGRYVIERQR